MILATESFEAEVKAARLRAGGIRCSEVNGGNGRGARLGWDFPLMHYVYVREEDYDAAVGLLDDGDKDQ